MTRATHTDPFVPEVVRLHETIEGWTTGRLPETDAAFAGFADALGPDFFIVNPEGATETREHVVTRFRQRHGKRGADFRIMVDDAKLRFVHGDLALVTYQEFWRRDGGPAGTILSSAWLQRDEAAPGAVLWLHLHETWLVPPPA